MKYKYFLRGFGFGILFATLILMCALAINENMPQNNSSKKDVLSSDVKESEKTSNDKHEDNNDSKDNNVEENDKETSTREEMSSQESKDTEENTNEDSGTSKSEEASDKETETTAQEEETTSREPETTSKEVETTSEEEDSSSEAGTDFPEEPSSIEMVVFTLSGGMSSNQVAQALKDLGVVESASDFNYYMESNGIAKRLRIGVYQIPKNASYSEIGNILVKKN